MRTDVPASLLSDPVPDAVRDVGAALQGLAGGAELPEVLSRWLTPLLAVSPYLLHVMRRYPEQLWQLHTESRLSSRDTGIDAQDLAAHLLAGLAAQAGVEADELAALRRTRHREMMGILWREFTGVATLDQTLQDLSALADACLIASEQWVHARLAGRFGEPRGPENRAQRLIVLGMGKLGGRELNVSSDVDLIYIYPESGDTDGKRSLTNAEFFQRVARGINSLLSSVTADGFVYRVDTRLRPFGESGPLVINLDGVEHYYLTQGRDWERYAMIKARPICGQPHAVKEWLSLMQPFTFRRYLDYDAIGALRDLKQKIALSLRQKGNCDNLKTGTGGIREIEFIAQAHQLVRGGRDTRLQQRSLKPVLRLLPELNLCSEADARGLINAYDALRRAENAVQGLRDQQTHSLPEEALDRQRLLAILDQPDWPTLLDWLAAHRTLVARCFAELFAENDPAEATTPVSPELQAARLVLASQGQAESLAEHLGGVLDGLGLGHDEALVQALAALCHGPSWQRLTARSQGRLERILPELFSVSLQQDDPPATLHRLLDFARTVAGRSGYLQVLVEQPQALVRLASLFSRSAWVARFVTRHPIVIDELLGELTDLPPTREAVLDEVRSEAELLLQQDLEEQMNGLRHLQQMRMLRIALAELAGGLSVMRVSDQLTWLAEAIIDLVLPMVEQPLQKRHGRPKCERNGEACHPGMAVVAYGKLGGLELGYGSDLDIVFLHDSAGEQQMTDGERPIDNTRYYARLAQKFTHFMVTTTPAGVLYEIDLRLRPNGQSGVLVSGLSGFAQYQQNNAWTWEHQALTRARVICGPDSVRSGFKAVRDQVLARQRDPVQLCTQVSDMRRRMREHLGSATAATVDLKQDAGGVADIEFVVQYLVLAHAHRHPELLQFTDNMRTIEQAERCGVLSSAAARQLEQAYLELRRAVHQLALQGEDVVQPAATNRPAVMDSVQQLWSDLMGPEREPSEPVPLSTSDPEALP